MAKLEASEARGGQATGSRGYRWPSYRQPRPQVDKVQAVDRLQVLTKAVGRQGYKQPGYRRPRLQAVAKATGGEATGGQGSCQPGLQAVAKL